MVAHPSLSRLCIAGCRGKVAICDGNIHIMVFGGRLPNFCQVLQNLWVGGPGIDEICLFARRPGVISIRVDGLADQLCVMIMIQVGLLCADTSYPFTAALLQ